jgi:membrane protease YdiL (CAAX protease family)
MIKSLWTIIWKSFSFFTLWAILYSPFVVLLAPKVENTALNSRLYYDATGALTIVIAAWVMVRLVERRSFMTLGFAPIHFVRDFTLGLIIGILWLVVSLVILRLFGWLTLQLTGQLDASTLFIAALAMLLNTLIQEVLSRGYIFQNIQSQSNATWAIIVTSIIFVLYHAAGLQGNWLPALNVFCAGVLFGVAYYRAGNLWLPIAIHFAWNFLLGPVFGLAVSGQDLANSCMSLPCTVPYYM